MFINVGAVHTADSSDVKTKKALKDALASDPASVTFYSTSGFSEKTRVTGAQLADGVKYSVTGPNPYSARAWYATVELAKGKIKVS